MAVIDLKLATILIKDGSSSAATATTLAAASAKGSRTVTLTAITGFAIGQAIFIGTGIQNYTIIGINTPGKVLTVYPPLLAAVSSGDAVDDIGHGLQVKIGEGNLTYDEKRNIEYVKDRGRLDTVKEGDEEPMDVSLDFTWEFLRSVDTTQPATIEEALKQIGNASGWTSTSVDPCEPYCVDIHIIYTPPCASDAEKIILRYYRWESLSHDLRQGRVSTKGKCNITQASVTHVAAA